MNDGHRKGPRLRIRYRTIGQPMREPCQFVPAGGGPIAQLTNLCLFDFDKTQARVRLRSVHPGHTLEEVRDLTGFDFDVPDVVPVTPAPDAQRLALRKPALSGGTGQLWPEPQGQRCRYELDFRVGVG